MPVRRKPAEADDTTAPKTGTTDAAAAEPDEAKPRRRRSASAATEPAERVEPKPRRPRAAPAPAETEAAPREAATTPAPDEQPAPADTNSSEPAGSRLRVKLVRSTIGHRAGARGTVRALGLHRLNETVEVNDTPENRGMLRRIAFLLEVTEPADASADGGGDR